MNSEWANALAQIRGNNSQDNSNTSFNNNFNNNNNNFDTKAYHHHNFSAKHNIALDTSLDIDETLDEELLEQDVQNDLENDMNVDNTNTLVKQNDIHSNRSNDDSIKLERNDSINQINNSEYSEKQSDNFNSFNNSTPLQQIHPMNQSNQFNQAKQEQQKQTYQQQRFSSLPSKNCDTSSLSHQSFSSSTTIPPPFKRQRTGNSLSQPKSRPPLSSNSSSASPLNPPQNFLTSSKSKPKLNSPNLSISSNSSSDHYIHSNSSRKDLSFSKFNEPTTTTKSSPNLASIPAPQQQKQKQQRQQQCYKGEPNLTKNSRIPGPAGDIDDEDVEAIGNDIVVDGGGTNHPNFGNDTINNEGGLDEDVGTGGDLLLPRPDPADFDKMGWRLMEEALEADEWIEEVGPGALSRYHIEYVKQVGYRRKVPVLGVIVRRIDYVQREAFIIVSDRTGSIGATVHRDVIEEYPAILTPGTVLLLRRVSVYVPAPASFYLNITVPNVDSVFSVSKSRRVSSHSSEGDPQQQNLTHTAPIEGMSFSNSPEL